MHAALIDDHVLLDVLRGAPPHELGRVSGQLWTTGLWHHRLSRALAASPVRGVLSRRTGTVDRRTDTAVRAALAQLPPHIGSVSMRQLAWPMAQLLAEGHRLNLVALEALATAEEVGATICLARANESPELMRAADTRGIEVRFVG
jgi:hypothetical protein